MPKIHWDGLKWVSVDDAGNPLGSLTWNGRGFDLQGSLGGSGAAPAAPAAPSPFVAHRATLAFDTPNLSTGVDVCTLHAGDVLLGYVRWTKTPFLQSGTLNPQVQLGTPAMFAAGTSIRTWQVFAPDQPWIVAEPSLLSISSGGYITSFAVYAAADVILQARLVANDTSTGSTDPWPGTPTVGEVEMAATVAPGFWA